MTLEYFFDKLTITLLISISVKVVQVIAHWGEGGNRFHFRTKKKEDDDKRQGKGHLSREHKQLFTHFLFP